MHSTKKVQNFYHKDGYETEYQNVCNVVLQFMKTVFVFVFVFSESFLDVNRRSTSSIYSFLNWLRLLSTYADSVKKIIKHHNSNSHISVAYMGWDGGSEWARQGSGCRASTATQ